jgi:DNA-binding LacI/PurR family transcriptional regulator
VVPPKRVTILDVAERAGVHPATVSRALSRPERVSASTRDRVERVARELGFKPNRAARSLITGHTGTVAIIVPDITSPEYSPMVRSVQRAARAADLTVVLVDTDNASADEPIAARAIAADVDGFIVLSPMRLHRELDALEGKPAVFVNRPVKNYSSVLMRASTGITDALEHLASLGHSNVAYLDGPKELWAARERRAAMRQAAESTGLQITEFTPFAANFLGAIAIAESVVGSGVSSVLASNYRLALGIVAGLIRLGVSIPDDLSVVGCDDVPMPALLWPALTTIAMPEREAGEAAVRLLREEARRVELFGTLVVRDSTGPARTAS